MNAYLPREQAWALLTQYNQEPFHLQHAVTVEAVMEWFAKELGYGEDAPFWATVGLLHDIDLNSGPKNTAKKRPNCWLK